MDDLASLDWNAPPPPNARKTASPAYPALQPTPLQSGRSTPLSAQLPSSLTTNLPRNANPLSSKSATPANNDSFASLLSLGSARPAQTNLTIQERQKQLLEEKARQTQEQTKKLQGLYAVSDHQFWDKLGNNATSPAPSLPSSGRGTPAGAIGSGGVYCPAAASPAVEDDALAAFNSSAPVNRASHFPPPSASSVASTPPIASQPSKNPYSGAFGNDDDDPFGLGRMAQKPAAATAPAVDNNGSNTDDDILGMLGRPVSELPPKPAPKQPLATARRPVEDYYEVSEKTSSNGPRDKALAELVDMGFPPEKSADALAQTDSGLDVRAAVGILLNSAHAEAKSKTRQTERSRDESAGRDEHRGRSESHNTSRADRSQTASRGAEAVPSWMRNQDSSRSASGQRQRQQNQTPAGDKDVAQYASDIGSTFLKSANSIWKVGQKKVQKAVAEFQESGDNSQPKWMKTTQSQETGRSTRGLESQKRTEPQQQQKANMTDEAMLLEGGGGPPSRQRAKQTAPAQDDFTTRRPEPSGFRDDNDMRRPDQRRSSPQPPTQQTQKPPTRLSRFEVEEQSSTQYVSPARRQRKQPSPAPIDQQQPIFSDESRATPPLQSKNPFLHPNSSPASRTATPSSKPATPAPSRPARTPTPSRPKAPPRKIPPASSSALSMSSQHRQKGTDAFKRGDFATALISYSQALSQLPDGHPATIIILCNRALTNTKVGDPKAALVDANAALSVIGVSRGEGEKISLGGAEGEKEMKEFFGKALMRKAEALENLEKWAEAGKVWKDAVEAGVGGSISIQGRNRCEKAAGGGGGGGNSGVSSGNGTPRPAPARKPAPPKKSQLASLSAGMEPEGEAVKKLREARDASAREEDEKFALTEQVDSKLIEWKGTKSDNLRALLGSLDRVLWPEAGWQKVGMSDLVMANRVKVVYMKAIAKVHPDKLAQNATVEQKMISASVFATLNEAWDKFKKDNNL